VIDVEAILARRRFLDEVADAADDLAARNALAFSAPFYVPSCHP
jgi:hypothetical protein